MVHAPAQYRLLLAAIAVSASPRCYARHWTDIVSPLLYQFPGLDEYRVTKIAERDPFDFLSSTSDFAPTTYPTQPHAPSASPTLSMQPTIALADHWVNSVENGTCPFGHVLYEVHLLDSLDSDDSDDSMTMSISRVVKSGDETGVLHVNRSEDNSTTTYSEIVEIEQPSGEIIFSGTVEQGLEGFQYVCLETDQCYSASVEGDSARHASRWEIRQAQNDIPQGEQVAGIPLATALTPTACEFSLPNVDSSGTPLCPVTCGSTSVTDADSGSSLEPVVQATAEPLMTTTTKQDVDINEPTGSPMIPKNIASEKLNVDSTTKQETEINETASSSNTPKTNADELNLDLSTAPSDAPSFVPSTVPTDMTVLGTKNDAASEKIVSSGGVSSDPAQSPPAADAIIVSEQTLRPTPNPSSLAPQGIANGATTAPTGSASSAQSMASSLDGSTLAPSATAMPTSGDANKFAPTIAPSSTPSKAGGKDASTVAPGKSDSLEVTDGNNDIPSDDASLEKKEGSKDTAAKEGGEDDASSNGSTLAPSTTASSESSTDATRGEFSTIAPSDIASSESSAYAGSAVPATAASSEQTRSPSPITSSTLVPADSALSGIADAPTFAPSRKASSEPTASPTISSGYFDSAPAETIAHKTMSPSPVSSMLTTYSSSTTPDPNFENATPEPIIASASPTPSAADSTDTIPISTSEQSKELFDENTSTESVGSSPNSATKTPPVLTTRPSIPRNGTAASPGAPSAAGGGGSSSGADSTNATLSGPTVSQSNETKVPPPSTNDFSVEVVVMIDPPKSANATVNGTSPSSVSDDQSSQAARRPPPEADPATSLATIDGLQSPSANASSSTDPISNIDDPSALPSRRPVQPTNSSGLEYLPPTNGSATNNQSTTSPRRSPMPPTNATTSSGVQSLPSNMASGTAAEPDYIHSNEGATTNQSTVLTRRPMPPTNVTTSAGVQSLPNNLASSTVAEPDYIPTNVGVTNNQSTVLTRRPMPPTNATTSTGFQSLPNNVPSSTIAESDSITTRVGVTGNQTTSPPRRPMPPANTSTTIAGSDSIVTYVVPTDNKTTSTPRKPIPTTSSSASGEPAYITPDVGATDNQPTAQARRPVPPASFTTPAGLAYSPTNVSTSANQSTTPPWRPMPPANATASAGSDNVHANVEQSTSTPRRPTPPTNSSTTVDGSTSPYARSSGNSQGGIPSSSTAPKYTTNNMSNNGIASTGVGVYSPTNVAAATSNHQTQAAPADGNDFTVEVVVMLDPPKSLAQNQTSTRPQVSTIGSFGAPNAGNTPAYQVGESNPTASGNASMESSATLPEHTTTTSTTNSTARAHASNAVYYQPPSTLNTANPSQLVSARGNATNDTVPQDLTNVTVPSSNPLYIRTRASSPPSVGGANTGDPRSDSRGNVRGKQQERHYEDSIPYQNYYYGTATKNEERRMGSNKAMRRRRG